MLIPASTPPSIAFRMFNRSPCVLTGLDLQVHMTMRTVRAYAIGAEQRYNVL